MKSIWQDTVRLPSFDPLHGDLRTDVLIVGGGLCGVLCAYMLDQANVPYALIEADRIMSGTSAHTTAKITSQHGLIYDKLIKRFGLERARMYLEANESALGRYRMLCREIDCGFEQKDAFVYSQSGLTDIERELHAMERIGFGASYESTLPLPFPIDGAIRFPDQAQFNPLKFAAAIAKGLNIYEHTAARAFEGCTVRTDDGRISADTIIMATHFPIINKHGAYFLKLYQSRSYVMALEHAPDVNGMYLDAQEGGLSLRNAEGMLLLGSGSHRTGKHGEGFSQLAALAKAYYPQAQEQARWAAQDCMTLDDVPYIGRYSKGTPNLYVAAGFGKWGMTSSMIAAGMLCDMVQDRHSPYAPLFDPSRSVWRTQLFVNAFESAAGLLTPTRPRCPHMGCALKWNAQEHTWDCPCHGSRFTANGKVTDTPATDNLHTKRRPAD